MLNRTKLMSFPMKLSEAGRVCGLGRNVGGCGRPEGDVAGTTMDENVGMETALQRYKRAWCGVGGEREWC